MSTEKAETKLFIEVTAMEAGVKAATAEKPETHWVRLVGTDGRGRFAKAVLWGAAATKISSEINKNLAPGEDIGSLKPIFELHGSWHYRERESNGKTKMDSTFYARNYLPVNGRELELNRIRRQSFKAISDAEKLRSEGKLDQAYMGLANLVADLGYFNLNLPEMEAEMNQAPGADEVFGEEASASVPDATVEQAENPEKTAAEHYRADNKINGAPPSDPEPISGVDAEAKPEEAEDDVAEAEEVHDASVAESEEVAEPAVESAPEVDKEEKVAAIVADEMPEPPVTRPARPGRATRPGM